MHAESCSCTVHSGCVNSAGLPVNCCNCQCSLCGSTTMTCDIINNLPTLPHYSAYTSVMGELEASTAQTQRMDSAVKQETPCVEQEKL